MFNPAPPFCGAFVLLNILNMPKGKGKAGIAVNGTPSHSYRVSLAIWDHTVLPTTWHKWTHPALTTARQAGTRFTYPEGTEGWVDLGDCYILIWFTCPQMVIHPSTNQAQCLLTSLIEANTLTTTLCRHQICPKLQLHKHAFQKFWGLAPYPHWGAAQPTSPLPFEFNYASHEMTPHLC